MDSDQIKIGYTCENLRHQSQVDGSTIKITIYSLFFFTLRISCLIPFQQIFPTAIEYWFFIHNINRVMPLTEPDR